MHQEDTGLNGILNYNESVNKGIEQLKNSPLIIECNNKDVKLLFVHFDEDTQKFDWACTYEL
jgi:hypothetical protein